jgi:thiol-disulfide isomerase/thioredoxin
MFKHWILILTLALSVKAGAQNASIVKFSAVENILNQQNDTTYVINFWATWCKPCVHELGNFTKIDSMYKGQKIRVILVSMDFVKDFNKQLLPFVKRKHIQTTVWLLNDPDYNSWIDKVDSSWGGALPATLIFNNKKHARVFKEDELNFEVLNELIKPLLTDNR